MNERVTILETKLVYQDELIEQLNQVVIEQQAKIDQLSEKVSFILDTIKMSGDPHISNSGGDDEPPPHY